MQANVEKNEDIYRLHIDLVPHENKKQEAVKFSRSSGKTIFKRNKTVSPDKEYEKTESKTWLFIKDKLQFIFVSVFVFAIIYVVLNWQALSINIIHYWNVWRGFQSPLENTVNTPPVEERLLPTNIASAQNSRASAPIPPLNLEVYPTDMRIIIPRINQNIPVVGVKNDNLIARRWDELEADIQGALRSGVVHYPGTALPGDNGNIVITGHSSYYAWDPGRFKDVFALLHDVKLGDKIVVFFNQKKFIYEVADIKVVQPQNVDVLGPTSVEQLTLITCTPIGTNLRRLVVSAKLIQKD